MERARSLKGVSYWMITWYKHQRKEDSLETLWELSSMGYSFKSRQTKYLVKEEIRTSDYRVSSEARKRLCYVSLTHFSAFPDHPKCPVS